MFAFFFSLFVFITGLVLSFYAIFIARSVPMLIVIVIFLASFLAVEFLFKLFKFLAGRFFRKNRRSH